MIKKQSRLLDIKRIKGDTAVDEKKIGVRLRSTNGTMTPVATVQWEDFDDFTLRERGRAVPAGIGLWGRGSVWMRGTVLLVLDFFYCSQRQVEVGSMNVDVEDILPPQHRPWEPTKTWCGPR